MPMQTYRAEIDVEDDAAAQCGCCCWRGPAKQLASIDGCGLTPGDPSPAGRCPECDALAYLEESKAGSSDALGALRDLLQQLERVGVYVAGEDAGQWAELAGVSFRRAEVAAGGAALDVPGAGEVVCHGAYLPTLVERLRAEAQADEDRAARRRTARSRK